MAVAELLQGELPEDPLVFMRALARNARDVRLLESSANIIKKIDNELLGATALRGSVSVERFDMSYPEISVAIIDLAEVQAARVLQPA